MKLANLRYGFACNSSSTHSVVVHKKKEKLPYNNKSNGDFGWDDFILRSDAAKRSYLKSILFSRLVSEVGEVVAKSAADQYLEGQIGDIDHQSLMIIPREFGTKNICLDFFQEMVQYVLRDDVVIYGGNDNQERTLPSSNVDWHKKVPKDTKAVSWIGRAQDDWWILFDRDTGLKITVSFKDNPAEYKYANIPELVDLKITDVCPYACVYCYQGSTHKGAHGEKLESWVSALAHAGVFEVAIGGGEPTLHPEFTRLLESKKKYAYGSAMGDLILNFTTRNFEWLQVHADLVSATCGAFAVSVDKQSDVERLLKLFAGTDLRNKCTVQYVMGAADDYDFERILEACGEEGLPLTLLGYKMTGRGATAKKKSLIRVVLQEGLDWIKAVKKAKSTIAIDTALAARVPKGTFPEYMIRRTEGTHSMYIDMVTQQAGISSYHSEHMQPVEMHKVGEMFKALQLKVD